jgi:prophage antirepressor-like protein
MTADTNKTDATGKVLEPVNFTYENHTIRAFKQDGETWLVAGDLAKMLGYRDAEHLTQNVDEDEKGTGNYVTPGGLQNMITVTESGCYHAIFRSKRPGAQKFRRWITGTVIPEIRRTGGYVPSGGKKHIPRDKPGDAAGLKGLDLTEYRVDRLTRETDRLEQILHDIRDSVVSRRWQVPVMLPDFGRYLVIADLGGVKIRGSMHKSFWHHDDLMMVAGLCESVDVIQRLWHQTATFVDRDHPQRELFERLSVNVDRATETAKRMKDLYEEDIKASKPFNPYFPASMD